MGLLAVTFHGCFADACSTGGTEIEGLRLRGVVRSLHLLYDEGMHVSISIALANQ